MARHTPEFENEDHLQRWLETQFESAGWKAIREVKPHFSNYRADLIVHHDDWGWIGIECKYMSSTRNGRNAAKALEQIVSQYRGRSYIGNKIFLWVFCPYFHKEDPNASFQTLRELFCYFGIGVINLYRSNLKMNFSHSNRDAKILIKSFNDYDDDRDFGDPSVIRQSVKSKIGKLQK